MRFVLEATVFVCGAAVMILELVASRVLGPYVGTSIYVWSSLIGIVMGSLSLGYYVGGRLSDRSPSRQVLSIIILLSGILTALTVLFKEPLLATLTSLELGLVTSSILAALILFFFPGFLLGMVAPYAAKLKMNDLKSAGRTVGNLSAISTAGSIFGTFLAGFYLIPAFGTSNILLLLASVLTAVSFILTAGSWKSLHLLSFLLIGVCSVSLASSRKIQRERGLLDLDTPYNRVWIMEGNRPADGRRVRVMGINAENHSSMFLDTTELVNEYTKYFHLARHFNPGFRKTLMLGGAGYSFPKDYLNKYPEATIDVVEIDPAVTALAREYFLLRDDPRLRIFHEDGRVYLNNNQEKYDVIFGDAFSSRHSIPFHLATKEAAQKMYDSLNDGGSLIQNVISSVEGPQGMFLRAELATLSSVFPQVYMFPVESSDAFELQNIILVARKSKSEIALTSNDQELAGYLSHRRSCEVTADLPVLTDDFAPVDYYIAKTL